MTTVATRPEPKIYSFDEMDISEAYMAQALLAFDARSKGQRMGPTTGFLQLDKVLGGFMAPGIIVVHGMPGVGKSAWAASVGALCQAPAFYVTTEMSGVEMVRRHVARHHKRVVSTLLSGRLTPDEEVALLTQAMEAAPLLAFADACTVPAEPQWLRTAFMVHRRTNPYGLLIIDSLHSWANGLGMSMPDVSEYELLNAAMQELRRIADGHHVPVLILAERNRTSMDKGGMSAAAGTRRIEYGANVMIELKVDESQAVMPGGVNIEMTILKNKSGPAGKTIKLWFQPQFMSFIEMPEGVERG